VGEYFEDLEVGAEYTSPGRKVTEADLVQFAGLSGDDAPLHTDERHAQRMPFAARIAQGALVLSLATGLMNRLALTRGTSLGLLGIENWRFLGPVRIGDTIYARVSIADKRASSTPGRGVLTRRICVVNQHGVTVQDGVLVSLVMTKPSEPKTSRA